MAGQSSTTGRKTSLPAIILIGLGAFLITLALALVFFVVPSQKKTPLDINSTTVTETVDGTVLVGRALASGTPTDMNADKPECRPAGGEEGEGAEGEGAEGEAAEGEEGEGAEGGAADAEIPVSCFIDAGIPMYSQRRVQAVEPSDGDVITLQAAQSLMREDIAGSDGVEGLINASVDRITLDRVSSEPVDEPTSTLQMTTTGDPEADAPTGFVREGLQYKFPFDAEQKDYDYFDASTFTTNPISFVGETEIKGIKAYEYRQDLGPIDMWSSIRDHFSSISTGYDQRVESILASYRREGQKAGVWGLEGDPERDVDMRRYYTNTRQIWVNPETGQIIDGKEDIFQFFAPSQEEADEFFADKAAVEEEIANPTRTAVRFQSGWNEETHEATGAAAQQTQDTLNTFGRIVPIVLGVLGVLSLVIGLVLGMRGGRGGRTARA
ncbi:DUF3068 domain-containing protein [Dietzia sp. 179-F 9C3 NHS]|uniref:DUF3068 domain-containing protein n=1 Tax=Dietzia sp. 179-F 9C3 NHS TaxID=3374295 RepID=UPI0038799D3C